MAEIINIDIEYDAYNIARYQYKIPSFYHLEGILNNRRNVMIRRYHMLFNNTVLESLDDLNRFYMLHHGFPLPNGVDFEAFLNDHRDFNFIWKFIELEGDGNVANLLIYYRYFLTFITFKLVYNVSYDFSTGRNDSNYYFNEMMKKFDIIEHYVNIFYDQGRRDYNEDPEHPNVDNRPDANVLNLVPQDAHQQIDIQALQQAIDDMFFDIEVRHFYIRESNNIYLSLFLECFNHIKVLNFYKFKKFYNCLNLYHLDLRRFFKVTGIFIFNTEPNEGNDNYNLNNYFKPISEEHDIIYSREKIQKRIADNSDFRGDIRNAAIDIKFHFNNQQEQQAFNNLFVNEQERNNCINLYNFLYTQIINEGLNNQFLHKYKYLKAYEKIISTVSFDLILCTRLSQGLITFDIEDDHIDPNNRPIFGKSVRGLFVVFYLLFLISRCDPDISVQELLMDYFNFLDEGMIIDNNLVYFIDGFKYGEGLYIGLIYFLYSKYGRIPTYYLELSFDNVIKDLLHDENYADSISVFDIKIDSTNEPAIPFYTLDLRNNLVITDYEQDENIKSIFPSLNYNQLGGIRRTNHRFYQRLYESFNILIHPNWHDWRKFNSNAECETPPEIVRNVLGNINIVESIRDIIQNHIGDVQPTRFNYLSKVLFVIYQFCKDNFFCPNVVYDMRLFSRLNLYAGIKRETLFFRNISVYGSLNLGNIFDNNNQIRFIKLMNICEIERYIISLKNSIGNRLPLYLCFYFNEFGQERYSRLMIPINRISTHFLTAAFLDNVNNIEVDDSAKTYEYYKAVRANSRLFYAFGMRSISGIQLNMDCIFVDNRTDVYGRYLPIKLLGYNDILKQFAFYTQIFTPEEKVDQSYNCFYWAIHINNYYGNKVFSDKELVDIYYKYAKGTITLERIKNFHLEYKINIRVKKIVYILGGIKKVKNDLILNKKEFNREITIGYIKYETFNHFFAIVPIRITKFCCKHLNLLKPEYYEIRTGSGLEIENYEIKSKTRIIRTYDDKDYANTFKLFKGLLKQELIEIVSAYEMEEYMNNIDEVKPNINMIMKYPEIQTKIIDTDEYDTTYRESKKKSRPIIAAADTETYVNENNDLVPFCLCLVYNNYEGEVIKESFYGPYCQRDFLNYLYDKNIREVYFHNLKFDGWLFKEFQIVDMVYHACRLYRLCILVGNKEKKKIYFKDSLALISTKLKNFPKMFELNNMEKELYPYNKINEEVVNNNVLKVDDCITEFNEKDFIEFKNMLINKGFIYDNNKIDIKSLTIYYCVRDCEILFYGLQKFEGMTMKLFNNINGLRFLTISSLSYYIMTEECFNKLPSYCGDIKKFIRMAIRGGRCMVANNKKCKVDEDIVDFDACSLYPSAMSRLYLPKGKVFGCKDKEQIKLIYKCLMDENQVVKTNTKFISAMIIKCKILKVGKNRSFPLLSFAENGLSNYSNEMVGKEIYLTHIELQDFIKYQEGEVEMIECIYWVGDKDTRMAEKIKYYYNLRAQYKKEGNPLQEVLKLFMNSSYGKTIQKDTKTEDRILHKVATDSFLKNNYGRVKEVIELNKESYWFKLDGSSASSYIPVQIGCLILGMSKRIMNEVICTAEDNNIDVYYQDTDSIHIKKKDVESLAKTFKASFGRELIGTGMGEFHVDFPLINNKETWSKKSIFLGKKCYIDCLTNIDGEEEDFIRMKGVPEKVIRNTAKDMNIQLYELYDKMYDGEEISFDLLNSNMPSFEYQKNFGIRLREEFKRILKFK